MLRFRARMALTGASTIAVVGSLVYGCSYDWTFVDPSARDGGDGGTNGEGSSEGAAGSDARPPEPPLPPQQPCKSFKDCSAGKEFCAFKDGLCGPERGPANALGVCTSLSEVCPSKPEANLCSCEGALVASRCEAAEKGYDIDQSQTGCVKPGPTFPCIGVPSGCKTGVQYCQVKAANPTSGACVTFTACSPPVSCAKCNPLPPPCVCKDEGPDAVRVDCP